MLTKEQYLARSTAERSESFKQFLAMPTIRLLISTLPATETQDVIRTLLEEAHAHAWNQAAAHTIVTMIESIMAKDSHR